MSKNYKQRVSNTNLFHYVLMIIRFKYTADRIKIILDELLEK